MPVTNFGKESLAIAIGSDLPNNFIQYCAIGSGSGTASVTDVTLIAERDRNLLTGSPDFDTARKAGFQFDFNSVEMSGIKLFEFGFLASGPALVGSVWQRESFGSIIFDGTNELQVFSTFEVL